MNGWKDIGININALKKEVRAFKRDIGGMISGSVERYIRKQGWDLVYYDDNTDFIKQFKLTEYAKKHNYFVYKDDTMTVVCIKAEYREQDKLFLALHEIAHLRFGHDIKKTSLSEEREANSFAEMCIRHSDIRL